MQSVAVTTQKGGVGKTTTAANLCHGLALSGYRVLAIDLDPQGHMATALGVPRERLGLDAVFRGERMIEEVSRTARGGLALVQPGARLNEIEGLVEGGAARGWLLRDAIRQVRDRDVVVVDCPPSSGLLGMNALLGTRDILVPVTGDYLALVGLSHLLGLLREIERKSGRAICKHILMTRLHARRRIDQEVLAKVCRYFPEDVMHAQIHEAVVLAEGPGFGKTIFDYRPASRSASEFRAVVVELMERMTGIHRRRVGT